jgi:hypothetical protein
VVSSTRFLRKLLHLFEADIPDSGQFDFVRMLSAGIQMDQEIAPVPTNPTFKGSDIFTS